MKKMISELRRDFILLSLAYIVIGALLLCFPGTASSMIAYLCAALLVAFGALHIISYCVRKLPGDVYRFDLVQGLIGLVLGVYICVKPGLLISFFPVVLGIVILVDSFVKLQNAIDLLRMEDKSWWIILLLAIITAVLAVLMLTNPFTTAELLLMFIGVALIANGVIDILTIFRLSYRIKKVTKAAQEAADALSNPEHTVTDVQTQPVPPAPQPPVTPAPEVAPSIPPTSPDSSTDPEEPPIPPIQ